MGKYIQEYCYSCCFFSDLTDYALYSLSTFPILFTLIMLHRMQPQGIYFLFGPTSLSSSHKASKNKLATKGMLHFCQLSSSFLFYQTFKKIACHAKLYAKHGGERGIRTLDALIKNIHDFQSCSFNRSDTSPRGINF